MVIKLDSGFEIIRFSDLAFEEMTVEIQYKGEQIAQINKDKGMHLLENGNEFQQRGMGLGIW